DPAFVVVGVVSGRADHVHARLRKPPPLRGDRGEIDVGRLCPFEQVRVGRGGCAGRGPYIGDRRILIDGLGKARGRLAVAGREGCPQHDRDGDSRRERWLAHGTTSLGERVTTV